jgi:SNF2 family DNA or RNA helicase
MLLSVKTREHFLKNILKPKKFDIVITTYEGVKTYIPELSRVKWEALIVD